jgi:hypothetical protein
VKLGRQVSSQVGGGFRASEVSSYGLILKVSSYGLTFKGVSQGLTTMVVEEQPKASRDKIQRVFM